MFLGEAATERCYFVLSPQARENEEAQIFQRILKLKPSQLLFWEEEEAGDKGKNIKGLQAALQEVMSSSLRYVSVEDMACLARELGIQVDQDFENVQGIQVSPGENLAGTVEDEGQQRHSQPQSSPGSPGETPVKEPVADCEVSQMLQNVHLGPVVTRHLQNSCPLPVRIGCNFNHVSLKAPWVRGSHFWSEQKTKWFHPSPFQNSRVHSRGKGFGIQYFQPQRFFSGERFMHFSRPARGRHVHGTFVRPPRPPCQRVQAWPEGSRERSARVVSQVGHLHSLSSQPAGPVGKPQSGQPRAWRTQIPEATGKLMRTASHTVNPHPQPFQSAGVMQKPTRPAFRQGFKQKMQGGPSNPVFRMGSHPVSNSKVLPSSQFRSNQPQPSQVKHSQPKPFQPMPSQLKHTQMKATHPQPSQAKCSPSKPTQPKPCQPQSSQSKPSQPKPAQPKSSQTRPSQAKAGPKRVGKH